jgi:hypothetical protein
MKTRTYISLRYNAIYRRWTKNGNTKLRNRTCVDCNKRTSVRNIECSSSMELHSVYPIRRKETVHKQVHVLFLLILVLLQGRPKLQNKMYMKYTVHTFIIYNTVACFPCAGMVEAWSLESGTQQKENEFLCKVCNSSRAGATCLPSLPLAPGRGHVTATCVLGDVTRPSRVGFQRL